ncbi:hypothetical protein ACT7DA_22035 [Bacillus pacificus]
MTKKVCKEVGLNIGEPILGYEIDALPDKALAKLAEETTVFAKLNQCKNLALYEYYKETDHCRLYGRWH